MCNCCAATETTINYLLRYRLYSVPIVKFHDGVHKFDSALQNSSEDQLPTVLLYGSEKYASNVNKENLRLTISYLKVSVIFCSNPLYLFACIYNICIYLFL